ncbi:Peptidase family M41 [Desulfofundulus australicus DSM 11792]|uniref:Peptidase family M41 n=1 Tax=Desulfofundulus australicus DSM 11792 TaxID=1121425 RepID=A0A1M4XUA0_9FIRM|nr:Peptidase family M41 [Desulfofundulus australicus DSM 11792]
MVAETLFPGQVTEVAIIEPWRARWFKFFNIDVNGFCKYTSMIDIRPTLDTAKNEICIMLSGAAAVDFFFPDLKLGGNRSDFSKAEELIQKTVNNGLSEAGPVTWNMLTEEQRNKIAQNIMKSEYERARKIISEHKDEILAVSKELKEKEHLTGEELRNILSSSPSKQ